MTRLFATASPFFGGSVIRCLLLGGSMGAGLLTTGLQSCWLVVSLSGGLTPSSASVDEAARLRGIMRKFVQGVVEIRSLKLGGLGARSRERGRGAKSKEQGAGSSKRRAFRFSVICSRLSGGQRGAEIPDQWPQDAASGGYSPRRIRPLADRLLVVGCDYDYEQEKELELIGG